MARKRRVVANPRPVHDDGVADLWPSGNVTKLHAGEHDRTPTADPWADHVVASEELAAHDHDMRGQFKTAQHALEYMRAGNATVTFRSKKTQTRFTYRLRQKKEDDVGPRGYITFVSVLTGSDNNSDYQYLGHFWELQGVYWHGRKSKIASDAPSAKAFDWVWRKLVSNQLPDELEIWHEGSCGRCGRKLTVPESVERGLGPECASKVS